MKKNSGGKIPKRCKNLTGDNLTTSHQFNKALFIFGPEIWVSILCPSELPRKVGTALTIHKTKYLNPTFSRSVSIIIDCKRLKLKVNGTLCRRRQLYIFQECYLIPLLQLNAGLWNTQEKQDFLQSHHSITWKKEEFFRMWNAFQRWNVENVM